MYDIATAAVEAALAAGARYADARVMELRTEAMAAQHGVVETLDREERAGIGALRPSPRPRISTIGTRPRPRPRPTIALGSLATSWRRPTVSGLPEPARPARPPLPSRTVVDSG